MNNTVQFVREKLKKVNTSRFLRIWVFECICGHRLFLLENLVHLFIYLVQVSEVGTFPSTAKQEVSQGPVRQEAERKRLLQEDKLPMTSKKRPDNRRRIWAEVSWTLAFLPCIIFEYHAWCFGSFYFYVRVCGEPCVDLPLFWTLLSASIGSLTQTVILDLKRT